MSDRGCRYAHSGDFVFRMIAGEAVLVPIRAGMAELSSVFTFNEIGALIWKLVDPCRSAEEIAQEVGRTYDVSAERSRSDTAEFLEQLLEMGLIRYAPEGIDRGDIWPEKLRRVQSDRT
jgi:hypothetical protein